MILSRSKVLALTTPTALVWAGVVLWPAPEPVPLPRPRPLLAYLAAPMPGAVPGGLVFGQRWAPLTAQPEGRLTVPDLVMPLGGAHTPTEAEVRRKPKAGGADICGRHGLRKVWTQDKRSWRCKR